MTQIKEQTARNAEFDRSFRTLGEEGKENALSILRALEFAQAVASAGEDCPGRYMDRSKTSIKM